MPKVEAFGIGIDIEEVARFKGCRTSLLKRIFTDKEIRYCKEMGRPEVHFAGRYTAKEAVIKALGSVGMAGLDLRDIEVLNNKDGAPVVRLKGLKDARCYEVKVSISHNKRSAISAAVVMVYD